MTFLDPKMGSLHLLPRHIAFASASIVILFTFFILAPWSTGPKLFSVTQSAHSSENTPPVGSARGKEHKSQSSPHDIDRVTNDTLGFSKIFVIGLPERSDKRDAIALASTLTGFHVDWVDGVRGEQIPDKAIPFGITRERLWNTNLGSWRGHMTAVRR